MSEGVASAELVTRLAAPILDSRSVVRVERLAGGSKKGVYRLGLDDSSSVVMYLWRPEENYWPVRSGSEPSGPLDDASGLDLFVGSHQVLLAAGIGVPSLLGWSAPSPDVGFALVEDLTGGPLEALLQTDGADAEAALQLFGADLKRMHALASPRCGKVTDPNRSAATSALPEDIVMARAVDDLRFAADQVPELRQVEPAVEAALGRRREGIQPRHDFHLVHGELGPDHVLLSRENVPVLIDIEGVMFFDVEWEHVFLQIRFGSWYSRLQAPELDPDRLRFYRLALYLSLVAGPLRLLQGDFPDRAPMLRIAQVNLGRVLHEMAAS